MYKQIVFILSCLSDSAQVRRGSYFEAQALYQSTGQNMRANSLSNIYRSYSMNTVLFVNATICFSENLFLAFMYTCLINIFISIQQQVLSLRYRTSTGTLNLNMLPTFSKITREQHYLNTVFICVT